MGLFGFWLWINWAMVSIIVNGSPTDEFEICWGLRQGDPLSLLFIYLS